MKKKSNSNDDLLVSSTRHHSPHSYGTDLSAMIMQDERNQHEKACHLCCLFAMTCPHYPVEAPHHSKRPDRIGWNENAILSFLDIWKDSATLLRPPSSALSDLPGCFHEQHTKEEQEQQKMKNNTASNISLWNTHDTKENDTRSHSSFISLVRRLPSPPRTPISPQSSISSDLSEPIIFKDQSSDNDRIDPFLLTNPTIHHDQTSDYRSRPSPLSSPSEPSPRKKPKIILNVPSTDEPIRLTAQKELSPLKLRPLTDHFPVTISQYIQDIHTKIETKMEAPKPKVISPKSLHTPVKTPVPLRTISEKICPRCGYDLTTSPFDSSKKFRSQSPLHLSKLAPTVPSCINDYLQINANASMSKDRLAIPHPSSINPFDSSLFQWRFLDLNEKGNVNIFCRRSSSKTTSSALFSNPNKSPRSSWITMLYSQRQLVPLDYASWNISYPGYSPSIFSLHRANSNLDNKEKNPFGRTGLIGRSIFPQYGANRYFIALILHQYHGESYILLEKDFQSGKWVLPKLKERPKHLLDQSVIIGYLDHPLNTDQSWLEVELILIKDNDGCFSRHSNWFSLASFSTFNHLEKFDEHLIKSYLFK